LVHARSDDDPAAKLVAAQFRGARIVESEDLGVGVAVVVGQRFKDLRRKSPESVEVQADTTVCAVPGTE
jgi:hypothetical protein